jgi:hypothetical protein
MQDFVDEAVLGTAEEHTGLMVFGFGVSLRRQRPLGLARPKFAIGAKPEQREAYQRGRPYATPSSLRPWPAAAQIVNSAQAE